MNDQLDSNTETVETLEPSAKSTGVLRPAAKSVRSNFVSESKPIAAKPEPARRTAFEDNEDDDDDTFIGRHKAKLAVLVVLVVVLVVGGAMAYLIANRGEAPPRKAPERVVIIQPFVPPPPPPPPPPPKVEPPPKMEEKMIEQAPVEDEPKPEPKPVDEAPALSTGIKGDGPSNGFSLGTRDGGRGGTGLGGGRGGGKWDGYARQVQLRIADALRKNRKTRSAQVSNLQFRIWPDSTGRITRAKLAKSTGDPALDAAIENEVLTGLQLQEPPPQGMPSPIVLRWSARRPN